MSRIGKLPVHLPAGVTVEVAAGNVVKVKGPLGQLSQKVDPDITVTVEGNVVTLARPTDLPRHRVEVAGQMAVFALGFSHEIHFQLPAEIKAEAEPVKKGQNPVLVLKSCDKQLIGQVAAKIRSFRKPEPYKGKGIKFVGETLRRKAGKSAGAK